MSSFFFIPEGHHFGPPCSLHLGALLSLLSVALSNTYPVYLQARRRRKRVFAFTY